jgi:hypothetical protein
LPHWDGAIFRPGKTDYAGRFPNEIPRPTDELIFLVEEVHVDDEVAREKFPCRLAFLPPLDLRDALGRDEDLENYVAHFLGLDPLLNVLAHLVLLSGEHVDDVPLIFWGEDVGHDYKRVRK